MNPLLIDPSPVSITSHNVPQGDVFAPGYSTNGTPLADRPLITRGIHVEVPTGDSITFCRRPILSPPTGAPTVTMTKTASFSLKLASTETLYVTACSTNVRALWEA